MPLSNLRYWIYRLRKESRPLVTETSKRSGQEAERPEQPSVVEGSRLLPVRVVASAPKTARQEMSAAAVLELVLPSGARLRFPAGTDLGYLRELAAALQVTVLTLPGAVRIFIGSNPLEMRRSIDGLRAVVEAELQEDVYSGHLFVFVSRRADRVKILAWDKGGFVLFYKRLERGQFKLPHIDQSTMAIEIDATQLAMLLDGIEYGKVRRPKKWQPSQSDRPGGRPMDKPPAT